MYRRIAACEPTVISFYMTDAGQEENIAALLQVAAELAGE